MENKKIKYSVLMSLYVKEKPEYLIESIESMINQTYPPSEIVIMKDGPLSLELDEVLNNYDAKYPTQFKIIAKPNNEGLGLALRDGLIACENEWIARMDTDDISCVDRCEKQIKIIEQHPEIDLVGSIYYEFIDSLDNKILRNAPQNHDDLALYLRKRNPFGHDSLMFKKSMVLKAGNYQHIIRFEDYDLWIRMLMQGCKFYNIQEPLLYVRGNQEYYNRRGGLAYLFQNIKFFKKHKKTGFFTLKDCVISLSARTMVCMVPGFLRSYIYINFLRKKGRSRNET